MPLSSSSSSSPAKRVRLSASRTSLSGRKSVSGVSGPGASSLPRATGSVMQSSNRQTSSTQPTYDFIAGEPNENERPVVARSTSRPPSRQGSVPPPMKRTTLRQSMLPKPETGNTAGGGGGMMHTSQTNTAQAEEMIALRARINSLEYEVKNLQSEKGLVALQHEKELREASARADADYTKFQNAETERLKAVRAAEAAGKEVVEVRDRVVNEKAALERKVREVQTKYDGVVEEKEDVDGRYSELMREYERFRADEVDGKRSQLERTLQESRAELESYKARLDTSHKRLEEREGDVERLEKRIMELNDSSGGNEQLDILKRELSDQVAYVKRLEAQVREQTTELKKLRDERKSVNVVEEEKRSLEIEMQVLREAETRAGELEIQKEILEDEKRMWTSLLEKEGGDESEHFESPEAVVKALVNERIEHALVLDRLGGVESELAGKDESIRALQSERSVLKLQVEKSAKSAGEPSNPDIPDNKAYKRLDRQRQLAVKEVEYLRAQLKTFDTEETVMMENANFDTQRSEQVKHLETLVDQYKSEIQTLHADLSKLESTPASSVATRGTKRAAEEPATEDGTTSEQLGPLLRKNKNLQTALQNATKTSQLLATELQASKSQLKALRASKSTRVLELRDNPTAQAETIKMNTIRTLKAENQELMAQLRGGGGKRVKTVPASALDAVTLDLQASEKTIAEKEKRMRRQREIWTEKAAEFRDVISSVLGYRITFMPNGKVKLTSLYYRPDPNPLDKTKDSPDEEDQDENYILFDGEKGTMKISGGPTGQFRTQVQPNVDFWVKDRKEIPLFLAAMSLEFYDKYGGLAEDISPPAA